MTLGPRLARLITLAAAPFAAAVLLAASGSRYWLCDLAAHATAQCAQVLLLASVALALLRKWLLSLCLLPFAVLACYQALPLWPTPRSVLEPSLDAAPASNSTRTNPPANALLRCASVNLLVSNTDRAAVLRACTELPLDVLVASELTERWLADLAPLRESLPYYVGRPAGVFGIGLWSRHPLRTSEVIPLGVAWAPAIRAVIDTPHGTLSVLGVHTPRASLFGQEWTDNRDLALDAIAEAIRALPKPRIVLGDCNATRWTAAYRTMLAASGLADTAEGAGWQPTWPVSLPSMLRIPIDQILVEPSVRVHRRWVGPETGSDHLPVFVELSLPR